MLAVQVDDSENSHAAGRGTLPLAPRRASGSGLSPGFCWGCVGFVALSAWAARAEPPPGDEARPARQLLARAGVAPDAGGAIRYLDQLQQSPQQVQATVQLVKELGHPDFHQRERASRSLGRMGASAEPQLVIAARSSDLEVALRARRVLRRIRSELDPELDDALLTAALEILAREPHPRTVVAILRALPALERRGHGDQASQLLWSKVAAGDADQLRQVLEQGSDVVRVAALPALELAIGQQAVGELKPFLAHPSESIRLAAARALVDRLPLPSVRALAELLDSDNPKVKLRAAWLLEQLLVDTEPDRQPQFPEQVAIWKRQLARLDQSALKLPLGPRRLHLKQFGVLFQENFTRSAPRIAERYGQLRYSTTVAGALASVSNHRLRLHGDHAEGDQSLFVEARHLIGATQFSLPLRVKAELGGEAAGSGTYHVGISLGNVRVLFHPGFPSGAFRIERVDDHRPLLNNQTMSFTPEAEATHHLEIRVTSQADGNAVLHTRITSRRNARLTYENRCQIQAADLGALERIGIDRSGRVGGAAICDAFEVDATGLAGR